MNSNTAARALLVLCALAAAAAAASAWSTVASAPPSEEMAEAWRLVGFGTFAALFSLLAVRPAEQLGLWVVVVTNKLVLSVSAATWLSQADGASQAVAGDGALTAVLLVALLLARPWRGVTGARRASGSQERSATPALLQ